MSLKTSINVINNLAESRGGKLLSTEYVNNKQKLLWRCYCGNEWESSWVNIKSRNTWCPFCIISSVGEEKIRQFLVNKNITYYFQHTFDDLKGQTKRKTKLRFDFYLPSYNVLIEYDGKQHFEPVNFGGCSNEIANKSFLELISNDNIKNEYCEINNITLIRISYKEKNIEKYLNEELSNLKIIT